MLHMCFKPIILSLSIVLGLSMCVLSTIVAQEEAAQAVATVATSEKTEETVGQREKRRCP